MEYLTINSFETKRSVTIDSLKTHFLPIQEGEGDPSPDNIRLITGWNSIKVIKCGKNLAKIAWFSAKGPTSSSTNKGLTNSNGTTISSIDYSNELIITQTGYQDTSNLGNYRNGYFYIVLDGLTYDKQFNVSFKVLNIVSNPLNATLSDICIENPHGTRISNPIVTEDGRLIYKNVNHKRNTTVSYSPRCGFAICVCGMSFTLSEFMITAVEDEDFTYEPYREEEVEVELPETMYGGYVDIAKGEIVETCKLISFGGTSAWSDGGVYTGHRFSRGVDSNASNARGNTDIIVCNYLKPAPNGQSANVAVYGNNIITASTTMKGVYVNVDFADTVDEWKAYLAEHPLIFIYNLETPIHYPIPPETLKTLRGFNTIFSTGNDSIEVGYSELSPMSLLELRRSIIASEPHLVTVETGNTEDSDVIASFKTNTTLPLKSMIVNFEPKQEGEGDPSPENIRPITGLSELEVHNYPHLVQWNQWLQPISEENWNPYNVNNISVAFSDGVVTSEWLVDSSGGYTTAVRNKVFIPNPEEHIWYVSYMVRHHAQDIKHFGVEFAGGRQIRAIVAAEPDVWYQVSTVGSWWRNNNAYVYISNVSNGEGEIGLIVETKSPVYIDLTQMYGVGNEPTKEEFEAQCALNGIDLTTYNPYDEGTVIPWRTSADEDRVYQIQLPENDCDLCTEAGIVITNNAFEVTDGVYRNLITDTRESLDIYIQTWKTSDTFSQNIVMTQSVDVGHLSITFSINDPNAQYIALAHNGKVRNITLLLNIPYTNGEYIISLDILSNDPTTVGGFQFTNIKLQYNDDPYSKKFYGGYIDVTSGEYIKTWRIVTLLPSIKLSYGSTYAYRFCFPFSSSMNQQRQTHGPRTSNLKKSYVVSSTGGFAIGKEFIENILGIEYTEEALQQYLQDQIDNGTPLQVIYPLQNPVHYQLDPTVIRTLKGTNNIYTNANGKSIIKYWTH